MRADWRKKLRDRRREAREVERRRGEEAAAAAAVAAAAAEAERAQRERAEAQRAVQELGAAAAARSAVLPQLEAAEVAWGRVRASTGGATAEEAVACWRGGSGRSAEIRLFSAGAGKVGGTVRAA